MSLIASVYIATSLDGFIAREDGSLDWLDSANARVPDGEDCGYIPFMGSVDVLVMGRNSFEKVLTLGPWPYMDKSVIVLSSRPLEIPVDLRKTVKHSSESPKELFDRLSQKGFSRLYIDGGITIRRFLEAGLINDITITVIPIIIGKGLSLFGGLIQDISLQHITTKIYDFGFVQSTYEIITNP
ncbi:MAG: dihydrofolate reductase family protein [Spirochaetia bacterium]|jgi:dihydrofolate reductase|nr:dihydrofolate reductase family protein [Spirochaetia bacterium]